MRWNRSATALGAALLVVVPVTVILARADEAPDTAPDAAPAAPERAQAAPADLPDLVFAANDGDGFRIAAVAPDGTGRVEVTAGRGMFPAWSPDGSALAYVGEHEAVTGTQLAVRMIADDGAVSTVTTGTQVPSNLAFRSTGELYYEASLQATSGAAGISASTSIDAVATRGGNQRTVIYEKGATYHPAWSPDGERLAYVAPQRSCDEHCAQALVVRSGGEAERVVEDAVAANPAWSPDGSRIAFSWRRRESPGIWAVAPGDRPVRITDGPKDDEPTWSPDGRTVAFTRDCDVWVQEVAGGPARNVTDTPQACEISPSWRPGGAG